MSIVKKYYFLNLSKGVFLLIGLFFYKSGFSQNPKISFSEDSVQIGQKISIHMVFLHAPDDEIFFPNKMEYFQPFEFHGTQVFRTQTNDSISRDSVIYQISTYEILKTQTLSLPVWLIEGDDSLVFWSNTDSLILKEFIPDSLIGESDLLPGTDFLSSRSGNRIQFWLIVILCFSALLFVLFKGLIFKKYKTYKFIKTQRVFNARFKKLMRYEPNINTLNEANELWRNQMTWISNLSYHTFSSLEIESFTKKKNLGEAIREIESSIFGGPKSDRIDLALQILYNFTNEQFRKKLKEFKKTL